MFTYFQTKIYVNILRLLINFIETKTSRFIELNNSQLLVFSWWLELVILNQVGLVWLSIVVPPKITKTDPGCRNIDEKIEKTGLNSEIK